MTKEVAFFVTCLVDELFPEVGEASVACLERAGCRLDFPRAQTCCGQPALNMGYRDEARRLARRFIEIFEPYDAIVAPSGSCTSMVRVFYPELFEGEPEWQERARRLASRIYELTEFLSKEGFRSGKEGASGVSKRVTYHDSCHLLRELGVCWPDRGILARSTCHRQLSDASGSGRHPDVGPRCPRAARQDAQRALAVWSKGSCGGQARPGRRRRQCGHDGRPGNAAEPAARDGGRGVSRRRSGEAREADLRNSRAREHAIAGTRRPD